jgi:uncharacterized repeat protein (TIGR01451 family)
MKTSQRTRRALRTRPVRAAAALAAGLVAVPAVMGAGHPGAARAAAARVPSAASAARTARSPELVVTVSDGHVAARAGETLAYLVTVRDTGRAAAPRLTITQTMSPGLRVLSASDHGAVASGRVSWSAGLPAGGSREFRVGAEVTRTPAAQLRLGAVACVTLPGSSRPVVCAAHLDRLPAAAALLPRSGGSGLSVTAYSGFGLVVVLLGGLAAAVVIRRRRHQQA